MVNIHASVCVVYLHFLSRRLLNSFQQNWTRFSRARIVAENNRERLTTRANCFQKKFFLPTIELSNELSNNNPEYNALIEAYWWNLESFLRRILLLIFYASV